MRHFDVLAWPDSGGFVLYVPDVEALTRARALDDIEPAAREMIAELLGLRAEAITINLRFREAPP
jgi:hypothetical protein